MAKRDPVVRNTKQHILDAALEVFGQHGFHGATVDDVANAAGITKGAVYYWFEDKDDLGRDLQHMLWEQFGADAMAELVSDRPLVDNLIAGFEAFIKSVQASGAQRVFLNDAWFSPTLDSAGRDDQAAWLGAVRGLVQEGIDAGEIVDLDADAIARILIGALVEATALALSTNDIEATLAVVRRLVGALRINPGNSRVLTTNPPTLRNHT